ncbi:MAG TPA: hypothetical protein VJ464_01360 [Blastocatellia bacterium]|nr:hypothetical protein [Blastocatellia bacterium]
MAYRTRPPESRIDIVIGPPDDPEIKGHIFKLAGSPSVKAFLAGLGWQEDFPIECWYSIVLNGKFFHTEFGRYTVEMIGSQVTAETAKNCSPCHALQYAGIFSESYPLLLWRQRVFYQAEKVWVPSLETTLSPTYPQVPYVESVWHPFQRTQEIVLSCPINTPKSIRDSLLKNGKRMLQQIKTEDIPSSRVVAFGDETIDHAIRTMAKQQIDKRRIAKFTKTAFCSALPAPFIMTPQNLYNYIPKEDPKWQQIESDYYERCKQIRGDSQKLQKLQKYQKPQKLQ